MSTRLVRSVIATVLTSGTMHLVACGEDGSGGTSEEDKEYGLGDGAPSGIGEPTEPFNPTQAQPERAPDEEPDVPGSLSPAGSGTPTELTLIGSDSFDLTAGSALSPKEVLGILNAANKLSKTDLASGYGVGLGMTVAKQVIAARPINSLQDLLSIPGLGPDEVDALLAWASANGYIPPCLPGELENGQFYGGNCGNSYRICQAGKGYYFEPGTGLQQWNHTAHWGAWVTPTLLVPNTMVQENGHLCGDKRYSNVSDPMPWDPLSSPIPEPGSLNAIPIWETCWTPDLDCDGIHPSCDAYAWHTGWPAFGKGSNAWTLSGEADFDMPLVNGDSACVDDAVTVSCSVQHWADTDISQGSVTCVVTGPGHPIATESGCGNYEYNSIQWNCPLQADGIFDCYPFVTGELRLKSPSIRQTSKISGQLLEGMQMRIAIESHSYDVSPDPNNYQLYPGYWCDYGNTTLPTNATEAGWITLN